MTEGQKSFWISIGAGAVLCAVAAPVAVVFWKNETRERALLRSEIAELSTKIAKNGEALAGIRQTASLDSIIKELGELNGRIKSANDSLAGTQKASLEGLAGRLDRLEADVRNTGETLAKLQKSVAFDGILKELSALDAKLKGVNDGLADIKKSVSLDGIVAKLGEINTKIASGNDALTVLQKATMTTGSTTPARSSEAETSFADLKKRIDEEKTLRGKLSDEIAKLQATLKTQAAPKAAASTSESDVVLVYVQAVAADAKAQASAISPHLTVSFEKIGSLDDNGQAGLIARRLKEITKGRSGCSIAVSGYADTLGGDETNLAISRKRAHVVAAKLQTALAGEKIAISEAAWGERRLVEWTGNEVSNKANRRVEVAVTCTPE